MAAIQVLEEGPRNLVLNVLSNAIETVTIVDVSALDPPCAEVRLDRITYDAAPTALARLSWDATTDVPFLTVSEGNGQTGCFKKIGGITNNAGAGVTGDVLLENTVAVAVHMVLHFVKKY